MTKIREGKGDKRGISIVKGSPGRKEHLRVTTSREERSRKDPLKIDKKRLKMKDPFKM
jgi:hypothetical protein